MRNYIDMLMKLTGGKSSGGSRAKRGKRENKYNARKTGGYDSKKEYRRACLLKALLRSGEISGLREQVKYVLIPPPNATPPANSSRRKAPTMLISSIEIKTAIDAKGVRTPEYRLKKKLMLQVHGIQITEI